MQQSGLDLFCKFLLVIVVAVLVRLCVGLGPFSGAGQAPRFGDYEAQRHWMEITTNLPILDWYRQTKDNDLSYWGLDYPPLSAYQSWLYGKILGLLDSRTVALHVSRGYEGSKALMRWSVLISDTVFVGAAVAWVLAFRNSWTSNTQVTTLACILLQPPLILIDHGHFQYNSISLGLSMAALVCIFQKHQVLGSILFCCAINHKHMALYFAPAIFGHLLGRAVEQRSFKQVLLLGITVISTFTIIWLPFLCDLRDQEYLHVAQRLVPVQRGVFEDYVANFWCVSNPFLHWKENFEQGTTILLCTICTLLFFLPSMVHQILHPSDRGCIYAVANSALSFYLFSYQTHEKSILLVLLPITMLTPWEPFLAKWMPIVSCFSMYPLLERDNLALQYGATVLLYLALPINPDQADYQSLWLGNWLSNHRKMLLTAWVWFSCTTACILHILRALVPSPTNLPFLYDALFVGFSFVQFSLVLVYMNLRQIMGAKCNRCLKRE